MNKKNQFLLARAISQAFVEGDPKSNEAQRFFNDLTRILKHDLQEAYPKFKGEAFVGLIHTTLVLATQHGDAPGRLTSVISSGVTYP